MDLCGGRQDAQSGPAGLQRGSGLAILHLQVQVEQQQTYELLHLVNGEVAAGTHGGAGAERHQVVPELLAILVEVRLLSAVLHETVELKPLRKQAEAKKDYNARKQY